jgi:hypothetical protein
MKTTDLLKKIETTGVISESEISLLKRRLNSGEKIDMSVIWDGEISITIDQATKGWNWLMSQYKTTSGKERVNNPFGYREIDVLEDKDHTLEFRGFYDAGRYNFHSYLPIYLACGAGTSFEYYVLGGVIQIIG